VNQNFQNVNQNIIVHPNTMRKPFHGLTFSMFGRLHPSQQHLKTMIQHLGGVVVDQPRSTSILITNQEEINKLIKGYFGC